MESDNLLHLDAILEFTPNFELCTKRSKPSCETYARSEQGADSIAKEDLESALEALLQNKSRGASI